MLSEQAQNAETYTNSPALSDPDVMQTTQAISNLYLEEQGDPEGLEYSEDDKKISDDESGIDHKSNVYIGNLPTTHNEAELAQIFAPFGTIVRCKIGKNRVTNQHAGYGFVQYDTVESAEKAINAMNGATIEDKILKVSIANPPRPAISRLTNVYICNLPPTVTHEDMDSMFAPFGTIIGSRLMLEASGLSKGVGFVRYETHEEALRSITEMNGTYPQGANSPITVKFAKEKTDRFQNFGAVPEFARPMVARYAIPYAFPYPSQMGMGMPFASVFPATQEREPRPKTNLYISGLPLQVGKPELEEMFHAFGNIIGSRVLVNPQSGVSRGIGFVRFDSHANALEAIRSMNGRIPANGSQPLLVKFARENDSARYRMNNAATTRFAMPVNSVPSMSNLSPTSYSRAAAVAAMSAATLQSPMMSAGHIHRGYPPTLNINPHFAPLPPSMYAIRGQFASPTFHTNVPQQFPSESVPFPWMQMSM